MRRSFRYWKWQHSTLKYTFRIASSWYVPEDAFGEMKVVGRTVGYQGHRRNFKSDTS